MNREKHVMNSLKVYDNRLVDENIGLKGELNASRLRCDELTIKENQVQTELSLSREKNSGLEVNHFIDQGLFELTRY